MGPDGERNGIYLYCIAECDKTLVFGNIGIEGNEVYTIPHKKLCAVVHNCPQKPYKSGDYETVKKWVIVHQSVVDKAWDEFGTVLPFGFDTIIKSEGVLDPEESMKKWLEDDHENLKQKIEKVKGKAEYGVQICWDPEIIGSKIAETNQEIKKLKEEVESKTKGTAYMYRQKLENAIKKELEKEADGYFKDFYAKIRKHADDTRIEKVKKIEKGQMLMNLSCLLYKDKAWEFGEELGKINELKGFSVRFTGPWPPYSFVAPG